MWPKRWRRSFRITRHVPDVERDIDDEIGLYLELRTEELIAQGMDREMAEREASAAFGDREQIAGQCRREARHTVRRRRFGAFLSALDSDLKLALRQMRRRPGFSVTVLLTWALCLGANAAIFSLVNGILLQPFPYPDDERLVTLFIAAADSQEAAATSNLEHYVQLRDDATALQDVACYNKVSAALGESGNVRNVFSMHVTTDFFDVLGVTPRIGRAFTPMDAEEGGLRQVIISHDLWQSQLGGDHQILSQELEIEGVPHRILGVMPEGFIFADWEAHLWFPIALPTGAPMESLRRRGGFHLVGRLTPEATLANLRSQLATLDTERFRNLSPELQRRVQEQGYGTQAYGLRDHAVRTIRQPLYILWAGVLCILLLGMVNIAGLLLVRGTARMRELATRFALGAGRWRVARQLVCESTALSLLGCGLGLLLGHWSLNLLAHFEAYEIPRVGDVRLDGWVIVFTLALSALTGAVAGLVPALAVPRHDLQGTLRSGNQPAAGGRAMGRLRGGLVAAQVALAFVLLVGALLLLTSLHRLLQVDPGFNTRGLLAAATVVPWERYSEMPARNQRIDEMLEAIRALPGVEEAAVASQLPFSGVSSQSILIPEGVAEHEVGELMAPYGTVVSPTYFAAMNLPILEGRAFSETDSDRRDRVVIVDELVARRYWPEGSAVGRRLRLEGSGSGDAEPIWLTVVGVAGRIVQNDLAQPETQGAFYTPHRDSGLTFMRLAVKTRVPPLSVVDAVDTTIVRGDPEARFFWVQSMDGAIAERLIFRRLPMLLLLTFAALALFLSALGVHGTLAQTVAQRRSEIGLRIALGSTRSAINRLVLRHGLIVVGLGLSVGLLGAVGLARLLRGLLYSVHPNDPKVLLAVAAILGLAGLLACFLPAHRASRLDPISVLKADG